MSDLALVVLAEMRAEARQAIAYAKRGGDAWFKDRMTVDAVAMRVRQLTELAKYSFPEDERQDYPQVPWSELARARDFYTHHYRELDVQRLQATVEGALQDLLNALDSLDLPNLDE